MQRNFVLSAAMLVIGALAVPVVSQAQAVGASLSGYHEVPAVSSSGSGAFRAKIDVAAGTIHWVLRYEGLEADALQSHIHVGQAGVNGGVSVFLCSNLGNGPAGTPACPLRSGELHGVITTESVIGPAVQGIGVGELEELVAAILARVAYVNVHSTAWPGGEIRGQLK